MRTWNSGLLVIGALAAGGLAVGLTASGCGGGEQRTTTSGLQMSAARSSGAERAQSGTPGDVVEVDESRLPRPATGQMTTVVRPPSGQATGQASAEMSGATSEQPSTTMPGTPSSPSVSAQAGMQGETTQSETTSRATTEGEEGELQLAITAADICPSDIESLRVRSRSLDDGAAFILTARGERDIERLRDRMRQFALAHSLSRERALRDQQASAGASPGATGATPSASLAIHGDDVSPPFAQVREIRLIEVANGVRVELHGGEEADRVTLQELRRSVREDVATLREGLCPISFQEVV